MSDMDKTIAAVSKWLGGSSVDMFDIHLYKTYGEYGKKTWTEAMTKSLEDRRRSRK